MRIKLIWAILMIFISNIFSAGMHLPGIGAKGIAMGGAFRAICDDPTSIYWNPAGLSNIDKSFEIQAIGQWIHNDFAFTPSDSLLSTAHVIRPVESKMTSSDFIVPHFFTTYQPDNKFSFGFGLYSPLGVASRWDVMKDDDLDYVTTYEYLMRDWELTTTEILPQEDFSGKIFAMTGSPAFSYKISEQLSVGIAATITYSSFDVDMPSIDSSRMAADSGIVFQNAKMKAINWGINAGIQYRPTNKLSIGLSIKYDSDFEYEGEYRDMIYKFYNEQVHDVFGILGGGYVESQWKDANMTLPRPLMMGFGIAYDLRKDITIAADISYTGWDVLDELIVYESETDSIVEQLKIGWENSMRYSMGGEWRFSRYALRAGVFFEPHPPVPEYQNLFLPDFNDNPAFNLGFAANYDNFIIETSFELEYFGEHKVEEHNNDKSTLITNIPGIYEGYVAAITLGVRYGGSGN